MIWKGDVSDARYYCWYHSCGNFRRCRRLHRKTEEKRRKMLMWGLFIFVAVPFPVTGVWTGTAIAVFLGMKFKDSFLPIVLGNLVAGSIITLLTFLLEP